MKFHITNAYKVNDTVEKETTTYLYSTADVAEKNEIPLTNYYDGNWVYKYNDEISGYDNKGFSVDAKYNYYRTIRAHYPYYNLSDFYIDTPLAGNQISSNADNAFYFNYYGNYKVTFFPIPAKHYIQNSSTQQTEFVDAVYYIPVARVTKDLTYSHIHYCVFEKLTGDSYLKCSPVNVDISHNHHFIMWENGGSYYGFRENNFTQYTDLGNYFNDMRGILVPQNKDGFIYASTAGISQSFGFTTIKSTRLGDGDSANNLMYYITNPIYFRNYINNIYRNYYMDFRFLPYTASIRDCYRYYQNHLSSITLENLLSYNNSTGYARIRFNEDNYDVFTGNMLYIGLDEFASWYADKLAGTGQDYIVNRELYTNQSANTIYDRVYPTCTDEHCQLILNEIKNMYNTSAFDIQLYENGFYGTVTDNRYQAGKFITRNINETTKVTTERVFNG